MTVKRDDSLWKAILEDLFDDFLRFFISDANDIFDMERGFEFLDKELEQLFPTNADEFFPRYVDKLVKVFTKNGTEEWILVHIEVQGSKDEHFSERMFSYFYRILDKYQKPITAFAILTDNNKKFHPTHYERSFLGTKLRYDFNSCKILELSEQQLSESNNPFALVALTVRVAIKKGKIKENELFELKLDLARLLLSKQFSKEKIRALMNFLKLYIRFGNEELVTKFEEEITIITNKTKQTMGIEEFVLERAKRIGKLEGKLEGNFNFVTSLLQNSDFDEAKIAFIASVPIDFVKKIKEGATLNDFKLQNK